MTKRISVKRIKSTDQHFEIIAPHEWSLPVVLNSPHSGSVIPEDLLAQTSLSGDALRRSEDCHVDELFEGCVSRGAPLLRSMVSRAYIDLNREPYELDPRMFTGPLPSHMNASSPRVLSGLGTLPRLVGDGDLIYRRKLELSDALTRINAYYFPYHRALTGLLDHVHAETGCVILIDCHSMPPSAVPGRQGQATVDVVLGDRFGASCDAEIMQVWRSGLMAAGLSVRLNHPYPGGFITETHGNPRSGRHALQIELNRGLYLNLGSAVKNNEFNELKKTLEQVFQQFAEYADQLNVTAVNRAAAE
jgi:N-formylglutamate amidohydrolase